MNREITERFARFETLGEATPFVDRIVEIIGHIKLLEDFDASEVTVLTHYMTTYRAPMGSEIIREGEPGDFMLLVLEGRVEIVKVDNRGVPVRVALVGPGKTLGEMSVIDGEPRFASCVAEDEVVFAVLDREHLTRLIADEPRIGVKLLTELLMLLNQRLRTVSNDLIKCRTDARLRIR